jgi:hypothetical protein
LDFVLSCFCGFGFWFGFSESLEVGFSGLGVWFCCFSNSLGEEFCDLGFWYCCLSDSLEEFCGLVLFCWFGGCV